MSSIHATPMRDRHQSSRQDSSSSHTSSPNTLRIASSGSTPSPRGNLLSTESLLSTHMSAPDPTLASLEFAVQDRNTLSGQNAQLWKLIEKQRAGYGQLLKELERVRGERDVYRGRLHALGESTDALLKAHKDKEKREGKDGGLRSAQSHTHLRHNASGNGGNGILDPRANLARTNSDDITSQPQLKAADPHWTTSRPRGRQRQGSQNSLNSLSVPPPQIPGSGSVSASSSSAHLPMLSSERSTESRKPPSLPLNPIRTGSMSSSPSEPTQDLSASTSSLTTPGLYSALDTSRTPMTGMGLGSWEDLPSSRGTLGSSQPDSVSLTPVEYAHGTSSSHIDIQEMPVKISPALAPPQLVVHSEVDPSPRDNSIVPPPGGDLLAPVRPQALSRESRISLPEEAKRYYASLPDSPSPSPLMGHGFPNSSNLASDTRNTESPQDLDNIQQNSVTSHSIDNENAQVVSRGEVGEFPDSEEVDDVGSVYGDSIDESGRDSIVYSIDVEGDERDEVREVDSGTLKKRATVEDFPLPPSTPPAHFGSEPYNQSQSSHQVCDPSMSRSHSETPSDEASSATHMSLDGTSLYNNSIAHESRNTRAQPSVRSAQTSQHSQPTFRALPLLASDLPRTQIQVTNSSIRPNDRGKDVLSFVIAVDAGNGKGGWKVEKLYSDVLTMDARVRGKIGKTLGKKLVSLPEGRLWKDHAPAKVDQRKAALETYMRSLIALPAKNKDEIVAFLTSDIVRDTQKPVSQAGYKEGYLTKRGKNFGGWKTRYFVLQGPSLEYYESRGGTHLGSIVITGAQIGRQQRNMNQREADEENEYRHAFLIIEAKKGPGGSNPRHVLCAESDEDRDAWVEELVRYVTGTYNQEELSVVQNGVQIQPGRTSTSSNAPNDLQTTPTRRIRKDETMKGSVAPISQVASDVSGSVKTDTSSYGEHLSTSAPADTPLSSSLPVSSPLVAEDLDAIPSVGQRANSELGHYPDLVDQRSVLAKTRQGDVSSEHQRRKDKRKSTMPLKATPIMERPSSPEKESGLHTPKVDTHGKVKISGPMNGTLIPAGYKFGGKEASPEPSITNDRREKAKSRSFWGFGRQHDKPIALAHVPRAVFGISLEESLDVAEIASLPAIVFRCIQYLEANQAEQEEGIYRLSGSSAVIKALKDRFNNEGDVDLLGSDEYWDPHAIAGLLKSFLRELPASILTRDLHLRFLSVIDFVDPQERIAELSQLIALLPIANYSLLRALTAHLILIVQNANINKMTMRNVGIVFSPTLGIPAGVFSLMLGEFKRVFNVDGAFAETSQAPAEIQDAEGEDISRRNSRHYSDAAADQLLGLSGRTLKVYEDTHSDDGGDVSAPEESGTEGTDNYTTENDSVMDTSQVQQHSQTDLLHPTDYSNNQGSTSSTTRAAHVAANRGLNISVNSKLNNRHSRVVGLPASPRPFHSPHSPHTPLTPQRSPGSQSSGQVPPSPLH